MKTALLFFSVLLLCACNNNEGKQAPESDISAAITVQDSSAHIVYNFTDTTLQARVTNHLMQLSFVKESDHYIDSISDHKKGISFITDTVNNEISVMAGYNGSERFETYYNFTINPGTFDIKVLDPVLGEFVPVAEYLKRTKDQH